MGINTFHFIRHQKKFFREGRESFFADINTFDPLAGIRAERDEKAEKKLQKKKKTEQQEQRIIKDIAEKIHNNTAKDKDITTLSKFSKNKIEAALKTSSQFGHKQRQKILAIINNKEAEEIQSFFSWRTTHKGAEISENYQSLLCSIPPDRMLSEHIKGDTINRKKYFSALQRISPKKAEMTLFVENFEKNPELLKSSKFSKKEQKIFFDIQQQVRAEKDKSILKKMADLGKIKNDGVGYALQGSLEYGNIITSTKEKEMLKAVETLGKGIAKNIAQEMGKVDAGNERERTRIFFESLQKFSQEEYAKLKNLTTEEISEKLQKDRTFYGKLLEIANYSPQQKQEEMNALTLHFDTAAEYLNVLHQEDRELLAEYFADPNNDFATNISAKDLAQIKEIEYARKGTKTQPGLDAQVYNLSEKYFAGMQDLNTHIQPLIHRRLKANEIFQSSEYKNFMKKHREFPQKILIDYIKGKKNICPYHFPGIKNFAIQEKFSAIEINRYINYPHTLHDGLPTNTLTNILKGKEPRENVSLFYKVNQFPKEKKAFVTALSATSRSVSNTFTEENFLFSNDEQKKNLSDLYTQTVNPKEIQESYSRIKGTLLPQLQELLESCESNTPYIQNSIAALIEVQKKMATPNFLEIKKGNYSFADQLKKFSNQTKDFLSIEEGLERSDHPQNIESHLKKTIEEYKILHSRGELENHITPTVLPERVRTNAELYAKFSKEIKGFLTKMISENITFKDFVHLKEIRHPDGGMFVQSFASLGNDKSQADEIAKNGFLFSIDENKIYLREDIYNDLQLEYDNPAQKDFITFHGSHEMVHMLYRNSNLKEIFCQKIGGKKFRELSGFANKMYRNDAGEGEPIEELLAMIGAALQNPKSIEEIGGMDGINSEQKEIIRDLFLSEGKEKIQKIFSKALEGFPQYNKDLTQKKFAASGGGEDINSSPAQPASIIDIQSRNELLKTFSSREKEMENALKTFRNFSSGVSSADKKHISEWDKYFTDKLAIDKKDLSTGAISLSDANTIKDNYSSNPDPKTPRGQLNNMLAKLSKNIEADTNIIVDVWKSTTFLSLNDIGRIWDTTWEYIKRRHETKAKRRVGQAGKSMFKGVVNGLANEFNKESENAEKEEVGKIKEALENKNTPDIYDFIKNTSEPDDLKGAIGVLAERGLIDWNRPEIWKALDRAGSGITFYPTDFENTVVRDNKYTKAFNSVYQDPDMFQELYNNNNSKIDSQIKSYETEAESRFGNLTQYLDQWIEDKHNGVYVDPMQYEAYVYSLRKGGKGTPESPLYYLIVGIAEGIIGPDAAVRFDTESLNNYPLSQFLDNKKPTKTEYQTWLKEILWNQETKSYDKPNSGVPDRFIHWIHKNVMTNTAVEQRAISNLESKPDNFDHDHARLLASIGSSTAAKSLLSLNSTSGAKFKTTIYNNTTAGILQQATSLALQADEIPRDEVRRIIARQAGFSTTFRQITLGKTSEKKPLYRFSSDGLQEKPREGGSYNDEMTTEDFLQANDYIYTNIPDDTFKKFKRRILENNSLKSDPKRMQEEWRKLLEDPEWQHIQEVMGLSSDSGENTFTMWEQIIPGVYKYFLDPPDNAHYSKEQVDANIDAVISAAQRVSAGTANNGNWKNIRDESSLASAPPNLSKIPQNELNKSMEDIWK